MALADMLTRTIATTKRGLLRGGLLQPVEWGIVVPVVPPDRPDPRGRKTYTFSTIDAFIEQRDALDRDRGVTDRNDDTVLTILDAVAITDSDLFRWGDPVHVYRVKAVEGLLKDEDTGVRYASEVTVIR